MNEARTFIVWVNEEDHIRIISMQQGCSLKQVYSRLIEVLNKQNLVFYLDNII